jgi:hypothetical protein
MTPEQTAEMIRVAINRQQAIKDAGAQLKKARTLNEYWDAMTLLCKLTEGKYI